MLSKLRGKVLSLFLGKKNNQLLKEALRYEYEGLCLQIENKKKEKEKRDTSAFPEFKFDTEHVNQQTKEDPLRSIFSLQNLKLLGTKEGNELTKLQQQLNAQIVAHFNSQKPAPNPQPRTQSKSEGTQTPQLPTQDKPPNPQALPHSSAQDVPPQVTPLSLTDEDKKIISQLTAPSTPINVDEADVATLQQLIQDKQIELDTLNTKDSTSNNTNLGVDNNNIGVGNPTDPNTAALDAAMSGLVEQIQQHKAMRAAGVAPDKLPKIDLSKVPTSVLKHLHRASQQSHPTNTKSQHIDK